MSKVITFSRNFQKTHPNAGEPTRFIEKIWEGLGLYLYTDPKQKDTGIWDEIELDVDSIFKPKYHTIRKGNRFRVGDKFSPRVWSGKPYCSKQIIIAPDIEIRKVWDIEISIPMGGICIDYDWHFMKYNSLLKKLAMNDGLSVKDFKDWFGNDYFTGQIICWNENINY